MRTIPKYRDPLYKHKLQPSYRPKKKNKTKKIRPHHIKDKLRHKPFELIQLDVLEYKSLGKRYYIYSAIDTKTRYAIAYAYTKHNSRNAKDFLMRLEVAFNLDKVRTSRTKVYLQSDNGHEFKGEFMKYALQRGYILINSRVRRPQENGYIERFNGISQREFLDYITVLDVEELNSKLLEYIKYYNYARIHTSLEYGYPIDKVIEGLELDQRSKDVIIGNLLSHLGVTWTLI